ncbi:glycosyltransferase family 2 protein [Candidatus Haliotispira prima]|uniref:Glycosyltransferase family 2 protein n=1 Tax=Candidatus Haliotispira prima TaxID=3034016 RepID=A0ABY8MMC7_9SPIO|nr:glycosyltransferase family 2 protein [Candidatus Haliotispira prima]
MTLPVSVIIPTYRRPELTAQALLSVYSQTAAPREILVLDDASGPSFAKLQRACEQTAARFHPSPIRLHVETLPRHLGMPGAVRNIAMLRSSSEWLAFLDSDDVWLPKKLQCQWQRQQETGTRVLHCRELWLRFNRPYIAPALALSDSDVRNEFDQQEFIMRLQQQLGHRKKQGKGQQAELLHLAENLLLPPAASHPLPGHHRLIPQIVSQKKQKQLREGSPARLWPDALKKCILGPSTLLLHRSVCRAVGYFDPKLQIAEDYEYFLRIIAQFAVAYCPDSLVAKRDSIPATFASSPEVLANNVPNVPQLSHLYPRIEPFRIAALEKLLDSPRAARLLSAAQRQEAIAELQRKLSICLAGARKNRNRPDGVRAGIAETAEIKSLQDKLQLWQNHP